MLFSSHYETIYLWWTFSLLSQSVSAVPFDISLHLPRLISSIHYNQCTARQFLYFTFSDNGFTHVYRMIAGCLFLSFSEWFLWIEKHTVSDVHLVRKSIGDGAKTICILSLKSFNGHYHFSLHFLHSTSQETRNCIKFISPSLTSFLWIFFFSL